MYRNCVYNSRNKECILYTWDDVGTRIVKTFPYNPYFYLETSDENYDALSIFQTKLKKREFDTSYERYKYLQNSSLKRYFYNLACEHQFLIDYFTSIGSYKDLNEFSKFPLKTCIIDIEVKAKDGFPVADNPDNEIELITVYNSLNETYYIFGLGNSYNNRSNEIYFQFCSEKELLKGFIKFFIQDYPDIVTGWNVNFDISYIINRLKFLFKEETPKILSPVSKISEKERLNKFKQRETYWVIKGISILDYMEVYKKFNPSEKPSYKLSYIAQEEINETKVEYDGSLHDLSVNDWQKYVEYNVKDVYLIKKMEETLKYLELIRRLANMGLCNYEDALGTIKNVDGVIAIKAIEKGLVIPTFVSDSSAEFIGAFVKEPIPGLYENVVSFDLNSLYPNTIVTCNMSPETKLGKFHYNDIDKKNGDVFIQFCNNKEYRIEKDKFDKFIKDKNIAISKANIMFDQSKQGIIPEIIDTYYKERVSIKKQLKDIKKNLQKTKDDSEKNKLKILANLCDIRQQALKIFLNSMYGYMGNKYAAMYDVDLAESVTRTGRAVIQSSEDILINIEKKLLGEKFVSGSSSIVYQDTDSITGDSLVDTNIGKIQIEDLYNICLENNPKQITYYGHEIVGNVKMKCLYYDWNFDKIQWGKIKNVIRHKVKKKKYKIVVDGKELITTEDHSLMVYRNGQYLRISPKEYKDGDMMIVK